MSARSIARVCGYFNYSLLALVVLIIPGIVAAHGGVQQHVGDVHVTFIQQPLSPLVGEAVRMNFLVTDEKDKPMADTLLSVKIIQTNPDAKHDREIFRQDVRTDVNGISEIRYTFPAEETYDVAVDIPGVTNNGEHAIGFLVAPRDVTQPDGYPTWRVLLALGIGALVGIGVMQTRAAFR